jgi:hypothetical protein
MKMNIFFFALAFLSSCIPTKDDLTKTPPTESILIGTWQEYGPKSPLLDPNGVVIDSVDINARFQFLSDFSYIAEHDIYTSASGTWSMDTTVFHINLYPQEPLYNTNSDHYWSIHKLDSADLEITHVYTVNLPEHSYTVSGQRNFKKIH